MRRLDRTTRRLPGLIWLRVFASPTAEPGKGWMFGGAVYRACIRVPLTPVHVGFLAMPTAQDPAGFRNHRRAVHVAKYGALSPRTRSGAAA